MSFPSITLIEADRVGLRPVAATDLPALLAINGDPQVTQFLPYATGRRWTTAPPGSRAWKRSAQRAPLSSSSSCGGPTLR
jgi:RimJ/RimL family protein N-acetyltransferase